MSVPYAQEFIVTLKNFEDLEEFYNDMETEGGNLYIPNRVVQVAHKRPISRNTHYMLTLEEADEVRRDPRVLSVELTPQELKIEPELHYVQSSSNFNKSSSTSSTMVNWGLLRCTLDENIANWGSNGTTTQSGTINIPASGKNVDVVIIDSIAYPNHPEFDTRYVQYDWFANHNAEVYPSNPNSTYAYDSFTGTNEHATHTSGTACGNTQGWARDANIYNLRFSSTYTPVQYLIDYVRAFHNSKPINPETGRKNPTITNNSWGYGISNWVSNYLNSITACHYRGTTYSPSGALAPQGISGVYSSNAQIAALQEFKDGTNHIVTSGAASATVTSVTHTGLSGTTGLVESTTPTSSDAGGYNSNDDGYWTLTLPFNIEFLGLSTNNIYVGTNGYITFESGSSVYSPTASNPAQRKLYITAGDLSCQRIWYGETGTTANRTYAVTNSGSSSYEINGSSNPSITLQRGLTYTFNVSSVGHPFWIKTSQTTGTESSYDSGVTNNGIDSGTVTFTVPLDAPDTLYYICQFHSSMTGTFNVTGTGPNREYTVRWEGSVSPSGSTGTNIIWEATFYEDTPAELDLVIGDNSRVASNFTVNELAAYGLINGSGGSIPSQVASLDADIADAIADGIIFVGSAGNDSYKMDVPGGDDWDNYFVLGGNNYYYHRGSSPGAATGMICVGAIGTTVNEEKASYSNCGPRVDIYAPGSDIISSLYNSGISVNGGFYGKYSGTSMAGPQVAGVLACLLEVYPRMTQAEALEWLLYYANNGAISETGSTYTDYLWLQGSANKYLHYHKERETQGQAHPKINYKLRPSTGMVFPRPKIYRSR